jgi:serine/threonine protein kinase
VVSGGGGSLGGLTPGSRVAGYLLQEQVGAGGMAVVYRAVDERLGRQVALKVLAPALASDEEFRRRFIRESRAAAAVDDPHIVPVYEAGEADGVLFIAMRYVAGGDVHALLHREGPLPPDQVAAIVSPVASALDAAHAAGLVHRDVKPTNMLLDARPGRPDHVYLADFGLSRAMLSSATLTGLGMFLGTPDYVAPEQIEGQPVTGQADQYALACTAFEMLTGQAPFRRDEARAVIWSHLSVPPPSLTSLRPGLPAGADQVFARAMAKAPADRYPRCADFAESLRGALGLAPYAHRVIPAPEPPAAAVPIPPGPTARPEPPAPVAQPEPPAPLVRPEPPAPAARPEPPAATPAEQIQTVASWPAQAAQTMPSQARSGPGPATAPTGPTGPTISNGATIAGEPGRPAPAGPTGPGARPAATKRRLAAGAAVAAVVVAYLVIAAVAHAFPFAKPAHHPLVEPTLPVTPVHQSTPATTPVSTPASSPASSIAPLAQLLPADIPVSSCSSSDPGTYNFTIVGATQVYDCQSGNWQVVAFQMDSSADYATTWQNFNTWIRFNSASAGTSCPPQGGTSAQGILPWSNRYFPQQNSQILECFTYFSGGTPFPDLAWSFPTEHAFLWASGNVGTSFSELDAWWRANQTQAAAPSPSP